MPMACSGSRNYSLQIDCFHDHALSPSSLPQGTVGAAYPNNLSASGGIGSSTFRVTLGSVPTGLTLNANGTWSGTATATGTFTFTVEARDTNGCTGSQQYTLTINCPQITINQTSIASGGTVGSSYSQTLTASGGTPAYTFSMTSGALPGGLALNNGTLSGTPTAFGTFNFTVQVSDGYGCTGSQACTLVISLPFLPGDRRFYADFDGDGKADLAIWRPTTATFWIYNSASSSVTTKQWALQQMCQCRETMMAMAKPTSRSGGHPLASG